MSQDHPTNRCLKEREWGELAEFMRHQRNDTVEILKKLNNGVTSEISAIKSGMCETKTQLRSMWVILTLVLAAIVGLAFRGLQ
jgi:hypothetical protein